MFTLREAEFACKKYYASWDKRQMTHVYSKAWKTEAKLVPERMRMHNKPHGIRRGEIMSLIEGRDTITADSVARSLQLPKQLASDSALYHLHCLMNEGVLRRVRGEKVTKYEWNTTTSS